MAPRCFANGGVAACAVHQWDDCGYGWLHVAPILLCLCLWVLVGVWMLRPHVTLRGLLRSDAARVHDPIAQGIAIALSQRKYRSLRQQRVQRAVRLLAMWAELPEFALVPLELAFRITGQPDGVEALMAILEFASEGSTIVMSLVCGSAMLLFHWFKRCHVFLDRIVHPLALDLFYIPMISAFLRLGTCPMSGEHFTLPGGIVCDCVDRFGYFWALGLISFVLLYRSALHHKMNVEPLATTMDFRFQPSYQFFIVMARTLSPIMSILVSNMNAGRNETIGLLTGLLFVWCFLLEYSYRTQPCIGSGSVPNNIRVLAFSSAIYTTLASIGVLTTDASLSTLLWTLIPQPLFGIAAWTINERRARLFHIPNVSIIELLKDDSPRIQLVGTVAALYVNPNRIVETDHEPLLIELRRLVDDPVHAPLSRLYALRTLWFSHIESFVAQAPSPIGDASTAIPHKYWLKDRANGDRPPRQAKNQHKYVKLTAESIVLQAHLRLPRRTSISSLLIDVQHRMQTQSRRQQSSVFQSMSRTTSMQNDTATCRIVVIHDCPWLSYSQPPNDAIATANDLFRLALDIWAQSAALQDRVAMRECALFLLQWYRTGHVYLQPVMYLQILSALCMVGSPKHIVDATHSLYNATLDKVTPVRLWLEHPGCIDHFAFALKVQSRSTVTKCASILALIVESAKSTRAPPRRWTPAAIESVEVALSAWPHVYRISDCLERVYTHLFEIHSAPPMPVERASSVQRALSISVYPSKFHRDLPTHTKPRDASASNDVATGPQPLPSLGSAQGPSSGTKMTLARAASLARSLHSVRPFPSESSRRRIQPMTCDVAETLTPTVTALAPSSSQTKLTPVTVLPRNGSWTKIMPTAALPEPLETGPHRISMTKVRQATKESMLMTDANVAELLDATDAAPRVVAECEKKIPAKASTPSRPPAPAPDAVPETVPSVVDGVAKIDVLSAAEQRRSERTQFIQILERAYELQTSTKAQTKRFGARDAVERAVELYRSPRECAISDYIETTLDPAIHEFFEPYMTARAPLSASEASSYWWRRLKLA